MIEGEVFPVFWGSVDEFCGGRVEMRVDEEFEDFSGWTGRELVEVVEDLCRRHRGGHVDEVF